MDRKLILVLCWMLSLPIIGNAQRAPKKHSPKKATIMSALLPGLGQVYNRKYWKVPIIYAGATALGFALVFNADKFSTYKNTYILRTDGDSTTIDNFDPMFSENNLLTLRDFYRRYLDLSIIGGILLYTLNVIDANVDAHLREFKVNDDLSLRIDPYFKRSSSGIKLTFNLH